MNSDRDEYGNAFATTEDFAETMLRKHSQHTYWASVESYRTAKGSQQRLVAYLGELKPSAPDGWAKLGAHLDGNPPARRPPLSLFDPPRAAQTSSGGVSDDEPVQVRLREV